MQSRKNELKMDFDDRNFWEVILLMCWSYGSVDCLMQAKGLLPPEAAVRNFLAQNVWLRWLLFYNWTTWSRSIWIFAFFWTHANSSVSNLIRFHWVESDFVFFYFQNFNCALSNFVRYIPYCISLFKRREMDWSIEKDPQGPWAWQTQRRESVYGRDTWEEL